MPLNDPQLQAKDSRLTVGPGLFRLCLAITVVVTHTSPLELGGSAVLLFFALSGFWVYGMWHSEYEKTTSPYFVFLVSRFWRLFPVYFLSLVLLVILSSYFGKSRLAYTVAGGGFDRLHFYFSNLLLFGLTRLGEGRMNPPAWSLDIELQFYCIAPLLILCIKSAQLRIPLYAIISLSLISSGFYLAYFEGENGVSGYLPMYLIFFLCGLATAHLKWRPKALLSKASLFLSLSYVIFMVALPHTRPIFLQGSFTTPISSDYVGANFLLAIFMLPYALATVRVDPKTRSGVLAGIDRHLSNVTYEVYLLHWFVLLIVDHVIIRRFGYINHYRGMPYFLAGYVFLGMISTVVYLCFDRPIDRLRRKFVKSKNRLKGFEAESLVSTGLVRKNAFDNAAN